MDEELATSIEEDEAYTRLKAGYRIEQGRVVLPCLWKDGTSNILPNYDYARGRLRSLLKTKIMNEENIKKAYEEVFNQWETDGIITQITLTDPRKKPTYYWPHFPVCRPDKTTTKVRPVFDGAAKVAGSCINDYLVQGPTNTNDLTKVLLRFRRFKHTVIADVSQMFLQISLTEEDKPFHRFLWAETPTLEPRIFEFNRHLFGNTGSPSVADFCITQTAELNKTLFPSAYDTVKCSRIVDDTLDSRETTKESIDLASQLRDLFPKCGMKIHKFLSNTRQVLESIPVNDRIKEARNIDELYTNPKGPEFKTLGIPWDALTDMFLFNMSAVHTPKETWTKLEILSVSHQIFDPLGFLLPILLKPKLILQQCWMGQYDWKHPLPNNINNSFNAWIEDIKKMDTMFPRLLMPYGKIETTELHVFSDASDNAYCAVAYIRQTKDEEVTVRFCMAKGKVTPLKGKKTTPRLELMGLELASRLSLHIANTIHIPIGRVQLWTDSGTTLDWLQIRDRNLQTFVKNRCNAITQRIPTDQIRWVSGEENPADIGTRGLLTEDLTNSTWTQGPSFLKNLDKSQWPKRPPHHKPSEEAKKEIKRNVDINLTIQTPLDPFRRISIWQTQVKIAARILALPKKLGEVIDLQLLKEAELALAYASQMRTLNDVHSQLMTGTIQKTHYLRKLAPFLDKTNKHRILIRLAGRIDIAKHLKAEMRCPVLLHPSDDYVQTLLRHYHTSVLQHTGGVNTLISQIQKKYWIIHPVASARKILRNCIICKKRDLRPTTQQMSNLPDFRIPGDTRTEVFSTCAIDCAGPYLTKQGRAKQRIKRYILLYRCTTVGAIHLQPLSRLDTDAFLLAVDRFISLFQKPTQFVSDNGSNFVRAEKEIRRMAKEMNEEDEMEGIIDMDKVYRRKGIPFLFAPPPQPSLLGSN